jgi:hypothetical protein
MLYISPSAVHSTNSCPALSYGQPASIYSSFTGVPPSTTQSQSAINQKTWNTLFDFDDEISSHLAPPTPPPRSQPERLDTQLAVQPPIKVSPTFLPGHSAAVPLSRSADDAAHAMQLVLKELLALARFGADQESRVALERTHDLTPMRADAHSPAAWEHNTMPPLLAARERAAVCKSYMVRSIVSPTGTRVAPNLSRSRAPPRFAPQLAYTRSPPRTRPHLRARARPHRCRPRAMALRPFSCQVLVGWNIWGFTTGEEEIYAAGGSSGWTR